MTTDPPEQFAWYADQLRLAGYAPTMGAREMSINNAVTKLLQVFNDQQHTDQTRRDTVELFAKLALNHSLVTEPEDEVWVPAQRGQVAVEDQIRVKNDAFDGPFGMINNGRRGVIVSIRRGEIWIAYRDGKNPPTPHGGIQMPVQYLEKRIR